MVNRGTDRERDIGKVDVLHLEPGDVVSIFAPSVGDTAIRASVTPSVCAPTCGQGPSRWNRLGEQYGVVLIGGQVDEAATADARAAMPPPAEGLFDFGPGRMALERRWPPALQDATIRLIGTVPPSVRDWCKHRIYDLIQVVAATRTPTVQDVDEAWRTIRSRLTRALDPDGTPAT